MPIEKSEDIDMKKLKKSPVSIVCYVIAALSLIYALYALASGYSYLNSYFSAYGTSIGANLGDAATYMLSQSFTPLCFAVMVFMCGHINEGVRALNPDNYVDVVVVDKAEADTDEASEAEPAELAEAEAETEVVEVGVDEMVEADEAEETSEPESDAETAEAEDAKNE